jgi:hypothetical protein
LSSPRSNGGVLTGQCHSRDPPSRRQGFLASHHIGHCHSTRTGPPAWVGRTSRGHPIPSSSSSCTKPSQTTQILASTFLSPSSPFSDRHPTDTPIFFSPGSAVLHPANLHRLPFPLHGCAIAFAASNEIEPQLLPVARRTKSTATKHHEFLRKGSNRQRQRLIGPSQPVLSAVRIRPRLLSAPTILLLLVASLSTHLKPSISLTHTHTPASRHDAFTTPFFPLLLLRRLPSTGPRLCHAADTVTTAAKQADRILHVKYAERSSSIGSNLVDSGISVHIRRRLRPEIHIHRRSPSPSSPPPRRRRAYPVPSRPPPGQ